MTLRVCTAASLSRHPLTSENKTIFVELKELDRPRLRVRRWSCLLNFCENLVHWFQRQLNSLAAKHYIMKADGLWWWRRNRVLAYGYRGPGLDSRRRLKFFHKKSNSAEGSTSCFAICQFFSLLLLLLSLCQIKSLCLASLVWCLHNSWSSFKL